MSYVRFVSALLLLSGALHAAPRWALQYHYDKDDAELRLLDVAFCSPQRGIATGAIVKQRGRPDGAALVTADGGKTWQLIETRDIGSSLFLLPDCSGWMVGEDGIWYTEEGGRDWRRVSKERVEEVYFLDAKRGFAAGAERRLLSTNDGGRSWDLVPAVEKLEVAEDRTVFRAIDFVGQRGLVVGNVVRPQSRSERTPIWADSEPRLRRERPSLMVVLTTQDGGKTWQSQTSSVFGAIEEIAYDQAGRGLLLIGFSDYFDYPSEVYRADAVDNLTMRALRFKDLDVTDVAVVDKGPAFAAGHKVRGLLPETPIPEKVQILRSDDLKLWIPMEVDYRAVARKVSLAVVDAKHAWAVTDTGMVLRLLTD